MSIFSEEYIEKVVGNFELDSQRVQFMEQWQSQLKQINDLFNPQRPKEKNLHEQFFTDVFEKALGYHKKSSARDDYTIGSEHRTETDATRPDGVLGFLGSDGNDDVRVVIELKSPGTDLDKRQNRANDKRTPVDQAFSYAHKYSNVEWVIVSNYDEIRLYQRQTSKHMEKFDLNDLTNSKNLNRLKLFFKLLSCENLLSKDKESSTNRIFRERAEELKYITDEFYEKYKEIRFKVAQHILKKQDGEDIEKAVNISQTLLDRVLFIAFLEDYHLINFKAIEDAYKERNKFDENPQSVWQNFKSLFKFMDKGRKELGIPPYNGGLFKNNPEIEKLDIDAQILKSYTDLRKYNFSSDLRVRILGHVFEKSITDLDMLKFELGKSDANDTRRHDEGAYYTPESVTTYIIERTLGVYLENIKERLGIDNLPDLKQEWMKWCNNLLEDKKKNGKASFQTWVTDKKNPIHQQHASFWKNYMAELQKIRIVDTACGSGAFLVAAFDYLEQTGNYINERMKELNLSLVLFSRWDSDLLKNNLFGVDISEEAIEITKLSLWLQIAKNKEALPALDDNILKCDAVAGKDWHELFPSIMAEGGFDIVIGNPPYLKAENFIPAKPVLESRFETYTGTADIYVYFYELGYNILKEGGYLGYISSNKWMRTQYGKKLRKLVKEKTTLLNLMDLKDRPLFEGATTYTNIITFKKEIPAKDNKFITSEIPFFKDTAILEQNKLDERGYHLEANPLFLALREKMEKIGPPLIDYSNISRGIGSGLNDAFFIDNATKEKLVREDPASAKIIKPLLKGEHVNRWHSDWQNSWVILTQKGIDIDSYPAIKKHLNRYKHELEKRRGNQNWYELQAGASTTNFEQDKIISPDIANSTTFCLDKSKYYTANTVYTISGENMLYLIAILNSKLMYWYLSSMSPTVRGGYTRFLYYIIEQSPIPQISKVKQEPFIELSERLHILAEQRNTILHDFFKLLQNNFNIERTGIQSGNWYLMEFKELIQRIKSKNTKHIPLAKEAEWLDIFSERKKEILDIDEQIATAEDDINTRVYSLYSLTPEEIELINAS